MDAMTHEAFAEKEEYESEEEGTESGEEDEDEEDPEEQELVRSRSLLPPTVTRIASDILDASSRICFRGVASIAVQRMPSDSNNMKKDIKKVSVEGESVEEKKKENLVEIYNVTMSTLSPR